MRRIGSVVLSLSLFIAFTAATSGLAKAAGFSVGNTVVNVNNYLTHPSVYPYFGTDTVVVDFEGPWSPPHPTTMSHFNLGAVGNTYRSQGVVFGASAEFMGGQSGFGWLTPPTVVGSRSYPYDGTIELSFVDPATGAPSTVKSVGAWVADGPTNDSTVYFYGAANNLLGTVRCPSGSAAVGGWNGFVGWNDPNGIRRVVFTNGGGDDYYIDNLAFSKTGRLFSITGRTVYSDSRGFPGVQVCANGTNCITTPDDGFFTFNNLAPGTYTITPTAAGYSFNPVSTTATIVDHDVDLGAFFGRGTLHAISGTIIGGGAGILVTTGTLSTSTDASGNYRLYPLADGHYAVTPNDSRYFFTPSAQSVDVNGADVSNVNFTATPLTYSVNGQVLGTNGQGLAGVQVCAGTNCVTTSAGGNFTIGALPAATYTVTPTLANYSFAPASVSEILLNQDVTIAPFTGTRLNNAITGTISGGGAGITVSAGSQSTTTDSSGNFRLYPLADGTYTVTPDDNRYHFSPTSQVRTLLGADATGVNFSATLNSACNDGIDNDSDGLVDLADPGCSSSDDQSETDPVVTPGAPTNLRASDGSSPDYVEVTWDTATDATSYQVYRSEYANDNGAALGQPVTGTVYQDRGAVPGVTYYYSAKAVNSAGTSGFSNTDTGFRFDVNGAGDSDGDGVSDGQETVDGTDPHDRGSFQLHLKSPAFSKYNTFLKQWNFLELIASGTKEITAKVTVYLLDGRELTNRQVVIPAQTEVDVDINSMISQACSFGSTCGNFSDLDGNGVIDTYGVVRIDFNNELAGETLSGRMSNYRKDKDNTNFSFAFAKELRNPTRGTTQASANTYDPQGQGYLVPNWLEIINLDNVARTFDTKLYDQEGKQVASNTVTVSPLGEKDLQAGHELTDVRGKVRENVYLAEVIPQDGAAQYFATVSRYSSNAPAGTEPESYNFAFAVDGRAGTGDTQYAVSSNETGACFSQTNWLEVINVRDKAVTASVIFRGTDGAVVANGIIDQVINQKAQYHFNAGAMVTKGEVASVELVSSDPGALIAQSLVYYHDCQDNKVQTAYVSPARIAGRDVQAGSINTFLGMQDQLRIVATGQDKTSVTAELRTFDAGAAAISATIELNNHNTSSVATSSGQFTVQSDRYGALTIRALEPGKFTAEVLRVRPAAGGRVDFAMPTVVQ